MADTDFTLTKDYLHQIFDYKDGNLFFKIKIGSRGLIGKKAGSFTKTGYFHTKIKSKCYLIHRLIFMMFYGHLPKEIDHINGIRTDNRIENLRSATTSQNQQNAKLRKDNKSGIKGVHWNKKDKIYKVELRFNKKIKYIGSFKDLELAELAAQEARDKYHGKFARHN